MNTFLLTAAIALGQVPDASVPASTAIDGTWTVVALEINGRPSTLTDKDRGLAIKNNTLTLPGVASMHGILRLDLGPKGALRVTPAATGSGTRRDANENAATLGVVGGANGVYVRTADYLVLTIGDPSAATATGTGAPSEPRATDTPVATPPTVVSGKVDTTTVTTVGQPPVTMVLRRASGSDAAPSTAAVPPPPVVDVAPVIAAPRRLSGMIGSNVTLSDGSTAGRIQDFMYTSTGAIESAVIDTNGRFSAVPFGALNFDGTAGLATLPLTPQQFGTLPALQAEAFGNAVATPGFAQQLQNTFSNFRDANGQPIFNPSAFGQTGNLQGTQQGLRPGNQPVGNQPGQTGNQPGQPNRPPNAGNQPNNPGNQPNRPPNAGNQGGQPNRPPGAGNQGGGPQNKPPGDRTPAGGGGQPKGGPPNKPPR